MQWNKLFSQYVTHRKAGYKDNEGLCHFPGTDNPEVKQNISEYIGHCILKKKKTFFNHIQMILIQMRLNDPEVEKV